MLDSTISDVFTQLTDQEILIGFAVKRFRLSVKIKQVFPW